MNLNYEVLSKATIADGPALDLEIAFLGAKLAAGRFEIDRVDEFTTGVALVASRIIEPGQLDQFHAICLAKTYLYLFIKISCYQMGL